MAEKSRSGYIRSGSSKFERMTFSEKAEQRAVKDLVLTKEKHSMDRDP
jgi:hypothetical protein